MRKVFAMTVLICALPLIAAAQAAGPVRAGFPERSLWLSNTAPSAGEEVRISTVLYNGTNAQVGGTLTFFNNDAKFSIQEVGLPPQSSSIVSATWVAIPGIHTFSAHFVGSAGSEAQQQTNSVKITVAEPPPPTALQQSVDKATVVAGQFASSSAPIVQKVAQTVFSQTEALRNAGAKGLEQYIENSRHPMVEGASTRATSTPNTKDSLFNSISQTAAAAALFVFRSIYLFYLLFVAILFTLLAWAYRRLRRPGR